MCVVRWRRRRQRRWWEIKVVLMGRIGSFFFFKCLTIKKLLTSITTRILRWISFNTIFHADDCLHVLRDRAKISLDFRCEKKFSDFSQIFSVVQSNWLFIFMLRGLKCLLNHFFHSKSVFHKEINVKKISIYFFLLFNKFTLFGPHPSESDFMGHFTHKNHFMKILWFFCSKIGLKLLSNIVLDS